MIQHFRQYKKQDQIPVIDSQAGFASMSKTAFPHLALQIDKTVQLHQQLAIMEAKYITLQQQVGMIKASLDNTAEEKSEKELLWLNMMYTHLNLVVSKFHETRIMPLKTQLWGMQMEFEGILNTEF